MRIGTSELIIILIIALLIFGPSRLPVLGKMVGKTVGQLKGYIGKLTDEIEDLDDDVKSNAVVESKQNL